MTNYEYSKDGVFHETMKAPDFIVEDETAECTLFIDDSDDLRELDSNIVFNMSEKVAETVESVQKSLADKKLVEKALDGSAQTDREINDSSAVAATELNVVQTPYDPYSLASFLEINEIHFRAMTVRVSDSVGREYTIKSKYPIRQEDADVEDTHGNTVTEADFQADCKTITDFIESSNSVKDFQQVNSLVAMDRIAIGWAGFEVIRSANGKIAKLNHIPAVRLRVLEGWAGFAEEVGYDNLDRKTKYTYYQPFGQKVGKMVDDPFNPDRKVFSPYDPERDGELDMIESELVWNFANKDTGKSVKISDPDDLSKVGKAFEESANELLFLPNDHINTIYYGYADVVPAIGAILANVYIRDYLLQFLEHNCVPRYAVIIKGAKVDDAFKKEISEYFKSKVKGNSYHTMILSLSGLGNKNIDITFEKIDTDHKEADFMETKKGNDQVIMTADGVSAALLGVNEQASLGSGKGLSQAEMYKNRLVVPSQLFWARKLNQLFKYGLGVLNAVIEFQPLDVKDALDVAQVLNLMLLNGVITINDARRQLGLPGPLEGGDTAFIRIKNSSFIRVEDIPTITSSLEEPTLGADGSAVDVEVDLATDDINESQLMDRITQLEAQIERLA